MTEYRRSEIVTGGFVVAAVALFALLAFRVGHADPLAALRPEPLRCETELDNAATLDVGARVSVAGRTVGRVQAMRLVPRPVEGGAAAALLAQGLEDPVRTRVEVRFTVDDLELRLDPATAFVQLGQDGLLGRHHLGLDPGVWSGADEPPTAAALRRADAALVLPAREQPGVQALLAEARPVLRRLGALIDPDDEDGLQRTVLAPVRALLGGADATLAELRSRLVDETLPRADRLLDEGAATIEEGRRTLVELQQVVEQEQPRLAALLDELTETTAEVAGRLDRIEKELTRTLQAARGTLDENRGEIAETVRRLRRTVWQAEMAMRKIRANPANLLWGDDAADLEAEPLDPSALWRSGRAPIYRQRDESDG